MKYYTLVHSLTIDTLTEMFQLQIETFYYFILFVI